MIELSRRSSFALVCASALGLASCDGCPAEDRTAVEEPARGSQSVDPELTLGLEPAVAQRRVALVDGEPITVLDIAREIARSSPVIAGRMLDADGRRALLEELAADRALAAEARERGLDDDPNVRRAREEVFVRALVEQIRRDVPEPTEAQMRAYYDAHRNQYRAPERRSAGLIFTRDRAAAEAALAELQDLRSLPENWMRVAERIGFAGPRRQPREDTDLFAATPREGEPFVPQPVRDAAFETEPGRVHPRPVPFEDGYYLVRVDALAEPQDIPFEAVRDSIRQLLHDEAVDAVLTQLVARSLAQASFDEEALATVRLPPSIASP